MLVRPILEYACVAWSPYHQCNIHTIEMVQRHAARYALNNYDRYTTVSEAWMAYFREQTQHPENCHDVQNYEQVSRCTQ